MDKAICQECGRKFAKKRSDQVFHSGDCRKIWWQRAVDRGLKLLPDVMSLCGDGAAIEAGTVSDIIAMAKGWHREDAARIAKRAKRAG